MGLYPQDLESALAGIPRSKGSKIFLVDYVNGVDTQSGTKWSQPLKTVNAAYAKCTTLHNDCVVVVGNGTNNLQAAAIAWAKDYTHLIGLTAPVRYAPRAVIQCPAAMATTPYVTFSANGCVVKNVTFWHASTDALSIRLMLLTGGYNYFENVHFATFIGTNNVTTGRGLTLQATTCVGNRFKDCLIGDDTTAAVQGVAQLEFLLAPTRNTFEDCIFRHQAAHTAVPFIVVALDHDMGRGNLFLRCLFENSKTSIVQAEVWTNGEAFVEPARPLMVDCWKYGVTDWDHTNRGVITNATIAANTTGDNSGNTMIVTSG